MGQWEALARKLGDDRAWGEFLRNYLAGELTSAKNPACPAAILGADVARRQDTIQADYLAEVRAFIDRTAAECGGDRRHAILSIAALVGATSLAAQVGQDKPLAREILAATRDELLKCRPAAAREAAKG
jgi:hypothetical protein